MEEILGKIPATLAKSCHYSKDLFDKNGNILTYKNTEYKELSFILENRFSYSKEISHEISIFLKLMLEYDYNKRSSAKELLKNKWLN